MTRLLAALLLATVPVFAAPAQSAPEIDLFETALAGGDLNVAGRQLDALLMKRRPTDGVARADPLLNGLFGRLALARGGPPQIAIAYLEAAEGAQVPTPQRRAALFALLSARERLGDRPGVREVLAKLRAEALPPGDRTRLILIEARLALLDRPAEAPALARQAAAQLGAKELWEADLIVSQAAALSGDLAGAAAAADKAWTGAALAPAAAAAPTRVGLHRAGLAAAAGDRDGTAAMLSAAGASISLVDSTITGALPVCGSAVGPADWAIFAAYTGTTSEHLLTPIAANRPGVAGIFYDALAGRTLMVKASTPPSGTTLTVRCRSLPSSGYTAVDRSAEPEIRWMVERGLLGAVTVDPSPEAISATADQIEALASKRPDSPLLIPLRMTLLRQLHDRALQSEDVQEWQVKQLAELIAAGVKKAGGADHLLPPDWLASSVAAIAQAGDPVTGTNLMRAQTLRQIREGQPDIAYGLAQQLFEADQDLPESTALEVVDQLLQRIQAGPDDPRIRALTMRRAFRLRDLKRGGDARAALKRIGIEAARLCPFLDAEPMLETYGITDDDYPADALNISVEGVSVIESDVTEEGKFASPRLILSTPSLLFDAVVAREAGDIQTSIPSDRGKPTSCRNQIQSIRWKLPEEQQWQMPTFAEPDDSAT